MIDTQHGVHPRKRRKTLTARRDPNAAAGAAAHGVAGREVDATLLYGQCAQCHAGMWPVLHELGADPEGFTPALQALATLAGVIEPYDAASTELLGRFAGVAVSAEKIQALVRQEGASASEVPAADVSTAGPPTSGPVCRPAAHEARRHAVASTGRRRHARPSIRLPEHGRPGPILGRPSGRMNGCRLRPPGVGRANEKFASR
jgi:hypothetical protein